jgi:hypothetical protein
VPAAERDGEDDLRGEAGVEGVAVTKQHARRSNMQDEATCKTKQHARRRNKAGRNNNAGSSTQDDATKREAALERIKKGESLAPFVWCNHDATAASW